MSTWSQFAASAPELASYGKTRLESRIAYLATTRPDGAPRVHPVSSFVTDTGLFVYMERSSPKGNDLRRDPRYALHCTVEDNSGGRGEFLVTGHAIEIDDTKIREKAFEQARKTGCNPRERYVLFELRIREAIATRYEQGTPQRTKWKAADQETNDSR